MLTAQPTRVWPAGTVGLKDANRSHFRARWLGSVALLDSRSSRSVLRVRGQMSARSGSLAGGLALLIGFIHGMGHARLAVGRLSAGRER